MALELSFTDLCASLQKLHDALQELNLTVVEDRATSGNPTCVERMGDTIADCLGALDSALASAGEGRLAVGYPVNADLARRALAACQAEFTDIEQRFLVDLMGYDRIAELTKLATRGGKRGGQWRKWVNAVRDAMSRCRQPIYDVNQALFRCWQEIAERAAGACVSVQTTAVGQQFTLPDGKPTLPARGT